MTTTPEIKRGSPLWPSNAERPTGLRDGDAYGIDNYSIRIWPSSIGERHWIGVDAITLPADHPLSLAQTWNDAHSGEPPFTAPWYGGDELPGDWDRGEVLLADGEVWGVRFHGTDWASWNLEQQNERRVVAYRRRATPAQPAASEGLPTYDDDLLTWLSGEHQLQLYHYSPMRGDDDDQCEEWRVDRVNGSINDREWETVGRGYTAIGALSAARLSLSAPTPEETATAAAHGVSVETVRAIVKQMQETAK